MTEPRDQLSASRLDLAIDAVCDEFERGLKSGRPSPIDATIAKYPYANKAELFRELVLLQLAYTPTEKRQELLEHYIIQFPPYLETLLDLLLAGKSDARLTRGPDEGGRDTEHPTDVTGSEPPIEVQRVAHYRVLERLGKGGFGTVYLAQDERLGRIVALKIPHNYSREEDRERFIREAKHAARLDHPGIVRVHDSGEADGVPYFVMEYVRGASLKNACSPERRGNRSECRQVVKIVLAIAQALAHAHSRGIIHRDLKPANILVDEEDRPRITDFGLAKRNHGDITLTDAGKLVGTLGYMAPEQASGGAQDVDGQADVYSLGVILFELLTGHLPFSGTPAALLLQLLNSEPPPPSRLVPGISKELDTICLRCLEKSPSSRYRSAEVLAQDLRLWLEGRPISVRPVGPLGKLLKSVKRHPVVSSLCVALCVALLGMAGLGMLAYLQAAVAERSLVQGGLRTLRHASAEAVPAVLQALGPVTEKVNEQAASVLAAEVMPAGERVRLAIAAEILDSSIKTQLIGDGLRAPLSEQPLYRLALLRHHPPDSSALWKVLRDDRQVHDARLRAALLLSFVDPANEQWESMADNVVALLLDREPSELREWLAQLQPCPATVITALKQRFMDEAASKSVTIALFELSQDHPQAIANLLFTAGESQAIALLECVKSQSDTWTEQVSGDLRQQLMAKLDDRNNYNPTPIVALAFLGADQPLLAKLSVSADQTLRTELMVQLSQTATTTELLRVLSHATHPDQEQALLVILGECLKREPLPAELALQGTLQKYLQSNDSGVHAAAASLHSQLKFASQLPRTAEPNTPKPQWYVTQVGPKMILVDPQARPLDESPAVRPGHAFYLAATELTVEQFGKAPGSTDNASSKDRNYPVGDVSFLEVAKYCNWFSKAEGIPESEWCYLTREDLTMQLAPDFLLKSGYRLPTRSEWDFACHGDTTTLHQFGDQTKRIDRFGWWLNNSGGRRQPVQRLWPDRQGLFDLLGNVMEMCHKEDGQSPPVCFMGGSVWARREGLGLRNAYETFQTTFEMGGFRLARSVVPQN